MNKYILTDNGIIVVLPRQIDCINSIFKEAYANKLGITYINFENNLPKLLKILYGIEASSQENKE